MLHRVIVSVYKCSYWQTLTTGDNVMIAENEFLIDVSPDGSRRVVKEVDKPVKVTKRLFTIVK